MIVSAREIKKSVGGMCTGCKMFSWDIVTVDDQDERGYIQIGCAHEELCEYIRKRTAAKTRESFCRLP